MENSSLTDIVNLIKNSKTFNVVGHIRPDGDCNGSCAAVTLALIGHGKTMQDDCDILFILDAGSPERIAKPELLEKAKVTILIDHHLKNEIKADYRFVFTDYSSCSELVYEILTACDYKITREIANELYLGIASDTGCFLWGTNLVRSHKIASQLDADFLQINFDNFRQLSLEQMELVKFALNNIKIYDGCISTLKLPKNKYSNVNQTDFLVKYVTEIKGINIGIYIVELEGDIYKAGLRSFGNIDVSIAARALGGGGHMHASGCQSYVGESYKSFLNRILEQCRIILKNTNGDNKITCNKKH